MNSKNKKLMALTAAALALPGMVPTIARAQTMPEKYSVNYRFTEYQEAEQAASTTNTGLAVDRYDISIHQLAIVAPVADNISLGLVASTETMSGASPWWVEPDADGNAVQVMSGATISEEREDIGLSANFYRESSRFGIGVSRSTENDYESLSININNTLSWNDKNTTLDLGFSFSDDTITPTQRAFTPRVIEEEKSSESYSIGLSQIVNKTLLVGAGVSYASYEGFLSDPYKRAYVVAGTLADSRPDTKEQLSIDLKVRKYFVDAAGALHFDYGFYDNNWGVESQKISLGWHQNFNSWQLSTSVRWYDQSAANFYENFYTQARADGYYASDYRLSSYGAVSYRVGLTKSFEFGKLKLIYEDYDSSGSGGDSNPGLVDFNFVTIGFDYDF